MTPHITKEDIEMMNKTEEWMYLGDDGFYHLKEDAPKEIKEHYEKIKKIYKSIL